MFLITMAVAASLITGGPATQTPPPSRAQMLKIYNQNAQLAEQSNQLGKELETIDRKLKITQDAITNLQYARAENRKYMDNQVQGK